MLISSNEMELCLRLNSKYRFAFESDVKQLFDCNRTDPYRFSIRFSIRLFVIKLLVELPAKCDCQSVGYRTPEVFDGMPSCKNRSKIRCLIGHWYSGIELVAFVLDVFQLEIRKKIRY